MKTKLLKSTILLLFITTFYACNDEQVKPEQDDHSETKQVVTTKTKLDQATFSLFGAGFKTGIGGRKAKGVHRFSGLFRSRAEAARVADDWDTCALVTITENADGTWTVILNFGEGCVDGEKFIKGVVAFTGSETDTSGVFKIAFDKFAEHKVGEEVKDPATLNGFYEGSWSVDSTLLVYVEAFKTAFEVTHENGKKESLAAEGELSGNAEGFVVSKYNFAGSNSNKDVFIGTVVNPLIFRYSCTNSYIYVKGTEAFQVNGKGAVVDYGNFECDNILTILQDGIIVIVDLDKINS